jgi:hypothetical protein
MVKYLVAKDDMENYVLIEQRKDSISNIIYETKIQDETYWSYKEGEILGEGDFEIVEEDSVIDGFYSFAIPKE